MWNYLKEWWNQPYWGTDFQKYQFAHFKSKMIFLLCGLIFLLFLISIAELDARFHIIEFLGIPCESIYVNLSIMKKDALQETNLGLNHYFE